MLIKTELPCWPNATQNHLGDLVKAVDDAIEIILA